MTVQRGSRCERTLRVALGFQLALSTTAIWSTAGNAYAQHQADAALGWGDRLLASGLVITREEIRATGFVTLDEVLQRLSSHANGLNTQSNELGNGASRLNLRSLGASSTLVLVNGRRFVPGGDGADDSVDLNAIPLSIVERIEVVTDSASAVYGSGAMTGIVNVVTRAGFEGLEAHALTGISERGDAWTYHLDATGGVDLGPGGFTVSAYLFEQEPVLAEDRSFSEEPVGFDWGSFDAAGSPDDFRPFILSGAGSTAVPEGRIIDRTGAPGNAAWEALDCSNATCQNSVDEGFRRVRGSDDSFNFKAPDYILTPSLRYGLHALGDYRFSEALSLFAEGSFNRRESTSQLASQPLFTIGSGVTVSADNIHNPFGRDFSDVRRRLVEAGPRRFEHDTNTYRLVVGARGQLPPFSMVSKWAWEVHFNYGRTDSAVASAAGLVLENLRRALGSNAECGGECVPLDLFGGAGSITPEMIEFIRFTGARAGTTEEYVAAARLSASLLELPTAETPIALSTGYTFRRLSGSDLPDPMNLPEEAVTGVAVQDSVASAGLEVHAVSLELSVPIVEEMPGVEALGVHAAARYSAFDADFDNLSYRLGVEWRPAASISIRGAFSTAFRAPTLRERFARGAVTFADVGDPCSLNPGIGQLSNPVVAANCAADGLAGGVLDPSTQIRAENGGNPGLQPETSESFTISAALEDDLVEGLGLALGYFSLSIHDAIGRTDAATILNGCYALSTRVFCNLVERSASTGGLTRIIEAPINAGTRRVEGLDFHLRYQAPDFGAGVFRLGLDGTLLVDLSSNGASVLGTKSQLGANPDLRLNGFLHWNWEVLEAGTQFLVVPGYTECRTETCGTEGVAPFSRPVEDFVQVDIFAGVRLNSGLGETRFSVGVHNLGDAPPPFLAEGVTNRVGADNYDFIGRRYYLRVSQSL